MGLRGLICAVVAVIATAWLCNLTTEVARAGALPAASAGIVDARAAARLAVRGATQRKAVRRKSVRKHRAGLVRASIRRSCRRHRNSCQRRARRAIHVQREQTPPIAAPAPLPAPIIDHTLSLPVQDDETDIVEREKDISIILSVATTLRGYSVEHAVSIVEVHDLETGYKSYRLVPGDPTKRTRDSAELAPIALGPNERLVADLHSHPQVRADSRDLTQISWARGATLANFYPGVDDYRAMLRRGVVSAIVDPDGGVMLLRRIGCAPSVRKIDGEPLEALDETSAARLEVSYLYSQGYLKDGDWVRPAVAISLHAGR